MDFLCLYGFLTTLKIGYFIYIAVEISLFGRTIERTSASSRRQLSDYREDDINDGIDPEAIDFGSLNRDTLELLHCEEMSNDDRPNTFEQNG